MVGPGGPTRSSCGPGAIRDHSARRGAASAAPICRSIRGAPGAWRTGSSAPSAAPACRERCGPPRWGAVPNVGRLLARRGFAHRVDARLAALDFGAWDGQPWNAIGAEEFAKWEADFVGHRPGGGESLASLMLRASAFLGDRSASRGAAITTVAGRPAAGLAGASPAACPVLLVGHAGWINAIRMLGQPVQAARWPAPIGSGRCFAFTSRLPGQPPRDRAPGRRSSRCRVDEVEPAEGCVRTVFPSCGRVNSSAIGIAGGNAAMPYLACTSHESVCG